MNTITTPDFMGKTARIIAEVRTKTFIDEVAAEVIKDALNEYCRMLDEYYAEEYYNALNTARNRAYDEGFDDGYDVGYDAGHSAV